MESDVAELTFFDNAWAWAETHRKEIVWGTAALAAAILIGGFVVWRRGENEANANSALSEVFTRAEPGKPVAPEALLKVASEHSGTPAAQRALLLAGVNYFAANKFAEAEAQFDKYVHQFGDTPFTGQALLGVAACLDAQGKTNEAITAYKNVAERRANDNVAPQARFAMANLLAAQGKLTEARDLYKSLEAAQSYTSVGSEAGVRYREMIMTHPELAQAATAPPTVMIPPSGAAQSVPAASPTNH